MDRPPSLCVYGLPPAPVSYKILIFTVLCASVMLPKQMKKTFKQALLSLIPSCCMSLIRNVPFSSRLDLYYLERKNQ